MNFKQSINVVSDQNKILILLIFVATGIAIVLFVLEDRIIGMQKDKISEMIEKSKNLNVYENLYNQIKLKKDKITDVKLFQTNVNTDEDEDFPVNTINDIARQYKMSIEWVDKAYDKNCTNEEKCMIVIISFTGEIKDFHFFLLNMLQLEETEVLKFVEIQSGRKKKDFMVHLRMSQKTVK